MFANPLIIFGVDFEVRLRVIASRADIRSLGTYDDVTAVAAFPDLDFGFFEDGLGLDIV